MLCCRNKSINEFKVIYSTLINLCSTLLALLRVSTPMITVLLRAIMIRSSHYQIFILLTSVILTRVCCANFQEYRLPEKVRPVVTYRFIGIRITL